MGDLGSQSIPLNAQQQKAVDIGEGPVLVVAGAGTGKTRVIVERVIKLINSGVKPENILALTFTEKAAGEMLERVSQSSLSAGLDTTITTFNGFGNDLLRLYGNEWGLGTVRLLGETGQLVFLREHLDELELDYFAPVSNPDGQLDRLATYVSSLKQQLIEPDDYTAFVKKLPSGTEAERLDKQKHSELAGFYQKYLELCRVQQVIDYDDQLFLTVQLLKARPNILQQLRGQYHYILVDEFQDTNPMQAALIDMLAGKHQNIMVVGDDDQSIYGWRGATLANILDFKHRYPKAKEVTLIENYRSTQEILDAAYRLIQHNNPDRLEIINKLDKQLHAQTNDGPVPKARHFASLDAELSWVAEDIQRRLSDGQDPSGIAVLARRRQGVEKVHEMLELHDIPHAIAGLTNDIYMQPVVKQLIEGLKAIADPLDDLALFHTLSGPLFGLELHLLSAAAATARQEHASLTDILQGVEDKTVKEALQILEGWRTGSGELSVGNLAYTALTDSGWKQHLYEQAEASTEVSVQVQALSKYFKTLKEFERIANVPSIQNYLLSLPALRAGGSDFEDASLDVSDSQVNVLSVHRAKGLEWDTVYIVDCTEGSFPLQNRGGNLQLPEELRVSSTHADEHMSEERRLMYVATTRAKRELVLTHADRQGGGAPRRPSRFLTELFGTTSNEVQADTNQTSLEFFAPKTSGGSMQLPATLQIDNTLVLSVSQIACWLDCPQDFYYKYVLGMPLPVSPAQQYGTAIHAAIEHIHKGRRAGEIPSLETVLEEVETSLPKAGYVSARSRERAHRQAVSTVKALYKRFASEPLPLESEKSFVVAVPDLALRIRGRLDAIYQVDNGIEIRDFKTGTSVTTAEKAKSRATSSKQLTLYALAWQLQHEEMPALLTLDFVETGQIQSVRKQSKSLETMRAKLKDMVENLQAGVYPAGKDHSHCQHPY